MGAGSIRGWVGSGAGSIRGWVGSGAMGDVFKAYDGELERMVAVKLVRTGLADQSRSERLQREARALARVSHPNVVQVFDVGLHEAQVFVADADPMAWGGTAIAS